MRRPRLLPLLLPLLYAAAFSQVVQQSFEKMSGLLTTKPSLTLYAASHLSCSARCSRMTYDKCTAYLFATDSGTCWLYSVSCLRTEPSADYPGVFSYVRPAQPTRWCSADSTLAFDSRCYTHRVSDVPLTWHEAQQACHDEDTCSTLAQPPDKGTYLALWAFNRPNATEWIGVEDLDGDGVVQNIDGSGSWTPPLVSLASAGPILMPDGYRHEVHRATATHSNVYHYVCQASVRCRAGTACPADWFLLMGHCYKHNTVALDWQDANNLCNSLGSGGRLASPSGIAIWKVLREKLVIHDIPIIVGASNIGGSWYTVNGGTVGVPWEDGMPDNAGGNENCTELNGYHLNDISCSFKRQFVCRMDARRC